MQPHTERMKTLFEVFNENEFNRGENLEEISKLKTELAFDEKRLAESRAKLDRALAEKESMDQAGHFLARHSCELVTLISYCSYASNGGF